MAFLLVKEGFSEEFAIEIASIYSHLRDFMRRREAWEICEHVELRRKYKAERAHADKLNRAKKHVWLDDPEAR